MLVSLSLFKFKTHRNVEKCVTKLKFSSETQAPCLKHQNDKQPYHYLTEAAQLQNLSCHQTVNKTEINHAWLKPSTRSI